MKVVAESYARSVSIRRVDTLVRSMGLDGISKLQVPEIGKRLEDTVSEFRDRVLDGGPFPFVWVEGVARRAKVHFVNSAGRGTYSS